jgi:Tfp pilus assembly protein PilV
MNVFKQTAKKRHGKQRGSSLLELLVATVVLMVGVVALAQLVPVAVALNSNNRIDSSSLVLAQQVMEQFVEVPSSTFSFPNAQGFSCTLGNGATFSPNVLGSPLVEGTAVIDFSSAKVAGYNFTYVDPEDPTGTSYDVRWAVISTGTAGNVMSRRFILGVRKSGGNGPLLPVTLDTLVEK